MNHWNELCTKDTTGSRALGAAVTERDQFEQSWFPKGVCRDGFHAQSALPTLTHEMAHPATSPARVVHIVEALIRVLRQWWHPVPHAEVRHKDVVREAHKQCSETLNRTMFALLGIAFFCLLTALGSPDRLLLAADSTIKVPFADAPMSFFGFIVVAPFLLIVLLIYLHIFYGYWIACEWERQYQYFGHFLSERG
jgi:hypothetical protein